MKQFITFLLMLVLHTINFGQEVAPQTQTVKPKTAAKIKKTKKIKPKIKVTPKITTLEAATKDGKAVTLKSNGTWEYTKPPAIAKASPTPAEKLISTPTPQPAAIPIAVVNPLTNPIIKPSPTPSAATTPIAKPLPNAKTEAFLLAKQCDLTLKESPVIRGLRLGMSRNDADRIIPANRVRYLDSSAITAYPQISKAAGFENVYQISAEFAEETLAFLEVTYDSDTVKWKDAKEFAENISANFNLPGRFWKYNGKSSSEGELQCREFSIKIDSAQNEIVLEKQAAPKKPEQAKEYPKNAFKP